MERKQFIKTLGLVIAGSAGAATLFGGCSSLYINYRLEGSKVIVKKSDLHESQFVLVNAANLPAPIYLRSLGGEEYIALLTRCTHKGCEVDAYYDKLSCPCHGSEYSYIGEVISPPAENPLMKFNVTTDENNIYIYTGEFKQ